MKFSERLLHIMATAALGFGLGLLIIVQGWFPVFLVQEALNSETTFNWFVWGVWAVVLVFCARAMAKELSGKIIVPGLLFTGGVLAFLSMDDAEKPPLADLGPTLSREAESYHIIMWMGKHSPYSRVRESGGLPDDLSTLKLPAEIKDWPDHITHHRLEIFQAWDQDHLGRDWIAAINAHPPRGIWPHGLYDSVLKFEPIRATIEVRAAKAYALALGGDRDQAIALLLPAIEAMQHVERTSAGLLHSAIATTVFNRYYKVIEAILDLGSISSKTKAALLQILRPAPIPPLVFRNAILGEQAVVRKTADLVSGMADGVDAGNIEARAEMARVYQAPGSRMIFFLGFNRNVTERMWVEYLQEVRDLATNRKVDDLKILDNWKLSTRLLLHSWHFKNPIGNMLVLGSRPEFAKFVESVWKAEDTRLIVQKRLESN